jgi:hypothetical protein
MYGIRDPPSYEAALRPLTVKFGVLKSDFREGLVKFFNKNTYEALALFSQSNRLKQVIVDIIKEPASYCLRERICRESEYIR